MSRRGKPKQQTKPPSDENVPEFFGKRLDNRPVPWDVQPPSKTAICHVDYRLGDSAALCVVPIQVSIKDEATDNPIPVTSRKLRCEAITELLNRLAPGKNIAHHLSHTTIKAGGKGEEKASPIEQLILFGSDKTDLLKALRGTYELNTTVMTIRKANGEMSAKPIYCNLISDGLKELAATDVDSTEYWRKLQIILRKSTQMATSSLTNKTAGFCTRTGSLLSYASNKSNDSKNALKEPSTKSDDEVTLREAPILNVLFRTTLKLDPNDRKIRAETDIVSGVRGGTNLSALILSTFGFAIVDSSNSSVLAKAKAMLVGLSVTRTYGRQSEPTPGPKAAATGMSHENGPISNSPPAKIRGALSDITTSTNNAAAQLSRPGVGNTTQKNPNSFPASTVIELKRAGDIPEFWKGNVRYSVAKYLKAYYDQTQPANFLNMPLANVGKDSWVPLHLLETVGSSTELQHVPSVGHMTTSLLEGLTRENIEANTENAKKVATNLIEKMRKSHSQLARILSDQIVACESVNHSPVPVTHISRAQNRASQSGRGIKYGMIYVQPKGLHDDGYKNLANLVADLLTAHAELEDDKKIVNIDQSFQGAVAVVPDIKPLLLPSSEQYPGVKAVHDSGPDTLIAIIDERGRSKLELRFIRSELQKFGNRKVGAVVQCISRKDLEIKNGRPSRFPIGALQHINAMHGNTNFVVHDAPEFPNRSLMVIGAHISHAGSDAASSCPSVASIVGSVDKDLMHYPGSARLQPTLKNTCWRKEMKLSKLKYEVESQIRDLKSMMIERIEAWVNKQGKVKAPHIVFYRHSNQVCNETTIQEEMQDIQIACDQFTGWEQGKITFSYVLVNKNAHSNSPYKSKDHPDKNSKQKFKITDGDAKGVGHKYEYFHKLLTRHLNSNYQLGKNANIAIALPVHFAQKLAKRMYDYFRFAVTNQYDSVSSVLRRLHRPDHEGAENDKEMTEMMNEYLLHYGGASAASESSEAPARKNPWLENLDDKMFYL
ncbi:hypothetical protein PTNB73_09056 [Pyrenophora teres f. teres]|nr:hypothetical protein HRS9122_08993 [Pyrenophora teres f. teres]KAE8857808.1 hypothetical protein PTNB73_09056 [Pyrenophora teres f. teres]